VLQTAPEVKGGSIYACVLQTAPEVRRKHLHLCAPDSTRGMATNTSCLTTICVTTGCVTPSCVPPSRGSCTPSFLPTPIPCWAVQCPDPSSLESFPIPAHGDREGHPREWRCAWKLQFHNPCSAYLPGFLAAHGLLHCTRSTCKPTSPSTSLRDQELDAGGAGCIETIDLHSQQ